MTQVMEPIRAVSADQKISLARIMVLTDFSGASDLALQHAIALARRYEAKIYLTHIISAASYQLAEPGLAEYTYQRMRQAVRVTALHVVQPAVAHTEEGEKKVRQASIDRMKEL